MPSIAGSRLLDRPTPLARCGRARPFAVGLAFSPSALDPRRSSCVASNALVSSTAFAALLAFGRPGSSTATSRSPSEADGKRLGRSSAPPPTTSRAWPSCPAMRAQQLAHLVLRGAFDAHGQVALRHAFRHADCLRKRNGDRARDPHGDRAARSAGHRQQRIMTFSANRGGCAPLQPRFLGFFLD